MLKKILAFSLLFLFSSFALAQDVIELDKIKKFDIEYREQIQTLKGALFVDDVMQAQEMVNENQKADLEDIQKLWNATINHNPMISFCLKKLSVPAEQRRVHSSLFAKSMSAIISGAAILPSFLGMNYGVQSGAYAAGRLATSLINKENNDKLQNPVMTDTEAIELASLVEDLQEEIIVNYYRYKGALLKLKKTREAILLANKNYSKALDENSTLNTIIASSEWDKELIEEYKIKQEVKKYQLALTRLAGSETINELNISSDYLIFQNINPNDLNYEKKYIDIQTQNEVSQ